jgi:hypothetical protein
VDPLGSIQKNREISMAAKCQFGVRANNYFSSDNARSSVQERTPDRVRGPVWKSYYKSDASFV